MNKVLTPETINELIAAGVPWWVVVILIPLVVLILRADKIITAIRTTSLAKKKYEDKRLDNASKLDNSVKKRVSGGTAKTSKKR